MPETVLYEIIIGPPDDPYPYKNTLIKTGEVSAKVIEAYVLEKEMTLAVRGAVESYMKGPPDGSISKAGG